MYRLVCTEHTSVQMGKAVQLCPYYHCNYELRDYVNTIGGIIEHNRMVTLFIMCNMKQAHKLSYTAITLY